MPPAARQLTQARLHALEMLSIWIAAEELEPNFVRLEPKLLDVNSAFIALQHETAALVQHYRSGSEEAYDTAHIEVMLQQSRDTVIRLRRRGAGAGAGSSVKVAHLLERLAQSLDRLELLLGIQTAADASQSLRLTIRLLNEMTMAAVEQHSTGLLRRRSIQMLAKSITENTSDHGEHYITRTPAEYRSMVHKAAGGGLVIAFTTLIKFGLYALALSAFWAGFWAGVNYAVSFVLVQLLHFTVATKQPAMTAPAMAAKLKELGSGDAIESFVDEITHLVRSQVAAVLGNVLVVMPVVLGIALLMLHTLGTPPISEKQALHVLESLHLLGPSVFFAAFTGVLLFASSIIAGWTENWFVLARMDSAIQYNPRITRLLGTARAARWAHFLRENISGFAANISLGFMLGLVPVIATFFGLGLDVRHVTLSAGQIAAACATLGLDVLHQPGFWWAVATLPLLGAFNVGVSFYLAFNLAMRARNVSGVERSRIYAAIRARLRSAPLSFFRPERARAA